jgi:hypothetical protein
MLRALCLTLAVLVMPLGYALGDPVTDPNTNAALSYWQAFATMPHLTDAEQNKLTSECLSMPLDAQTRELVDRAHYSLQMMHRGAALPQCDWGIGTEEGIYTRVPQGPAARVLCSLACLRARMRFAERENALAVTDILDGMALARHLSQDSLLIVLLVSYNIEHRMADALAFYLPKLDAKETQDLRVRLAALPPPVSGGKLLRIEEKHALDWLIRTVKDTKDQDKLLAQLAPLFIREGPGRSTPQEQLAKARDFLKDCGGSAEGIVRFAEKARPSYASLASKFDLPPAEFEKEFQIEEKKQTGNPVFEAMYPALRKVHQQQARAYVRRALLMAAIAVQLDGQGAEKNVPDPVIGQPFEYVPFEGGFQLRSKLKGQDNQPLSVIIDRRGK